jgi:hypothetical protein
MFLLLPSEFYMYRHFSNYRMPHILHAIAQGSKIMVAKCVVYVRELCRMLGPERAVNMDGMEWPGVQGRTM